MCQPCGFEASLILLYIKLIKYINIIMFYDITKGSGLVIVGQQ